MIIINRLSRKFVQLSLNYIHETFHLYHRVERKILLRFIFICTVCVNCFARKKHVFNIIFKCVSDKSKLSIQGMFLWKRATSTEITCVRCICRTMEKVRYEYLLFTHRFCHHLAGFRQKPFQILDFDLFETHLNMVLNMCFFFLQSN